MAKLNDAHRHVLEDFIQEARIAVTNIMVSKGLSQRQVTDSLLREIGTVFPKNEKELSRITSGKLNPETQKIFSSTLLRLVNIARNNYEAIMAVQGEDVDSNHEASEEEDMDPNHNLVVEISDDELDEDELSPSDDEFGETESSRYFSVNDEAGRSSKSKF